MFFVVVGYGAAYDAAVGAGLVGHAPESGPVVEVDAYAVAYAVCEGGI